MEGFVYILQSIKSGHYYIGVAENIKRRLNQHNLGLVKATKNKGPWEMKFFQIYPSLSIAKKIEYKLKKLKRRDVIERIITDKNISLKVD